MSDSREVRDFLVRLNRVRNDLGEATTSCQIVLRDLEKNKVKLEKQQEEKDNYLRLEHKLKGEFIAERTKLENQSAELSEATLKLAELRKHRQKVAKQLRSLDQEHANVKLELARASKEADSWRERAQECSKKLERVNKERIKKRDKAMAKENLCEELLAKLDAVKEEVKEARRALTKELNV
jgi:chromosome segregation ATPase